jgi:hypothetical protein
MAGISIVITLYEQVIKGKKEANNRSVIVYYHIIGKDLTKLPLMLDMLKIELGDLKEKGDDLATFLEKKLKIKPSMEGGLMILDNEEAKARLKKSIVKAYLKRYLYANDLRNNYKVFVKGNELQLIKMEVKKEG